MHACIHSCMNISTSPERTKNNMIHILCFESWIEQLCMPVCVSVPTYQDCTMHALYVYFKVCMHIRTYVYVNVSLHMVSVCCVYACTCAYACAHVHVFTYGVSMYSINITECVYTDAYVYV
jgi:hypothetical protein